MADVGRVSGAGETFRSDSVNRAAARTARDERPGESSGVDRGRDSVDVSDTARIAAAKLSTDESAIRQDLVDRVRAEIEAGTYETPIRIAGTVDAMLGAVE